MGDGEKQRPLWVGFVYWWGGRTLPSAVVVGAVVSLAAAWMVSVRWGEDAGNNTGGVFALALLVTYPLCRRAAHWALHEAVDRQLRPAPMVSVPCTLTSPDGTVKARRIARDGHQLYLVITVPTANGTVGAGERTYTLDDVTRWHGDDDTLILRMADGHTVAVTGYTSRPELDRLPADLARRPSPS